MPCTEEQLFAFFDQLGITHETTRHPPLFTVEEGRDWGHKIPGLHCKNLFVKDKAGQLWLIVMPAAKRADLKAIATRVGTAKFSFAQPDEMMEVLRLSPGSVTPFALLNDKDKKVRIVLDRDMLEADKVNYHPLHNAASTTLKTTDLVKFLAALDYNPVIVECG